MIDFESRNYQGAAGNSSSADFEKRIKVIEGILLQDRANKLALGWELLELWRSRSYFKSRFIYNEMYNLSGRCFFRFLEEAFDLDKSRVSRLMNVVDEFCQEAPPELDLHWRPFSYSALVEMLPMTPSQREQITPMWSARRIREFKKSLLTTGPGTSDEVFHNCCDVATPVENSDFDDEDVLDGVAEPGEGTPVSDDIRLHPSYKYYLQRDKEFLATRIVTLEIEQRELIRIINDNGIIVDPV